MKTSENKQLRQWNK